MLTTFLPGYRIGHATDRERRTGCTVVLPPAGTIAAVDVRGGAPGTRETGVFTPGNLISEIHALVFAGGSAFGLAAADGVMEWLRQKGIGVRVGPARVPIVASAILFDLAVGDPHAYPDAAMGRSACEVASETDIPLGPVGAATGATVGKLFGVGEAAEGGIGIAAVQLPGGERIAALAAVNSFGDVVDPDDGTILAGPRRQRLRRTTVRALCEDGVLATPLAGGGHTTLLCVASTVPFEPASLKRVAIEAGDGIARAVRPAHTLVDGDVVFALAPEGRCPEILLRIRIGAAAAEAAGRAIANAVRTRAASA